MPQSALFWRKSREFLKPQNCKMHFLNHVWYLVPTELMVVSPPIEEMVWVCYSYIKLAVRSWHQSVCWLCCTKLPFDLWPSLWLSGLTCMQGCEITFPIASSSQNIHSHFLLPTWWPVSSFWYFPLSISMLVCIACTYLLLQINQCHKVHDTILKENPYSGGKVGNCKYIFFKPQNCLS